MAREAGLFRKYNLETSLIYIPGAAQVIQTMLAGEIHLAAAAPSGVVDVVLGGGDLVTIAGMVNIPAFCLVVRPHVGIVARRSFLVGRRETVKKFLQAYCEGVAFLTRDKERSKTFLARYVHSNEPEVLESTWQYAIDTIERIPYPDPEGLKVVLEERARTRPEIARARPEQFIDNSI